MKRKKNIYVCFFHSFCATDLNFGTKNNGRMKYSILKTLLFPSWWGSPLVQFSKFKNVLWVCWFLCKNLSNFLSLPWKLQNPYCHNVTHTRMLGSWSKWPKDQALLIQQSRHSRHSKEPKTVNYFHFLWSEMEIIPSIHFYPLGQVLGHSERHFMNTIY